MDFLHTKSDDPKSPVDSMRVNWFYRPRDVQRVISDTRLLYGTMHSDTCPTPRLKVPSQVILSKLHGVRIGDFEGSHQKQ